MRKIALNRTSCKVLLTKIPQNTLKYLLVKNGVDDLNALIYQALGGWAILDSNQRLPACKAGAFMRKFALKSTSCKVFAR